MKRVLILTAIFLQVILNCSKDNITNNYFPSPEFGAIVGYVSPPEPNVDMIVYLGTQVASTRADSVGYFELVDLLPGVYSLAAEADGWVDYQGPRKVSVTGGSTVAVDTIFLISIHDLVEYVYPFDGAQHVGLDERIRIRFRRSMNTDSVERAFSLEPEVEGDFYWYAQGEPPSYYYSELQFVPRNWYASNTTYHVTIDTSASDYEGIRLSEPYQFSFASEPIAVTSTMPLHRETWVSRKTRVQIFFNARMDMQSVILAFKMVDSQLNDVAGEYLPQYQRSLSFMPDSALAGGETYTVTIDTNAKDLHGGSLAEPYVFWFTTCP